MPWQQSSFPLLIVSAGTGYSGVFVYSPSPGLGNLFSSDAASSGTDPYGNAYVAGQISYTEVGGVWIAQGWQGGAVYFATATSPAGPYTEASGRLRQIGTLNPGWTAGDDVNGTSDPPTVTQTDSGTIVMAGRLVTPASGSIGPTVPFGTLGPPFVLPASGGVVPEYPTSNAGGGQTGSVILRPNGNMALNGNFVNNTTVLTSGAFRFSS